MRASRQPKNFLDAAEVNIVWGVGTAHYFKYFSLIISVEFF